MNPTRATAMGRYPWTEVLLLEFFHITFPYPTRQHAYRVVAIAAMVYLAAQIYPTPEVTDPIKTTYLVGCTIAAQFIFNTYLLFAEGSFPDQWRRVRDEVEAKTEAGSPDRLPSDFPLTKKLWWMANLAYGGRMIGWVQEPRSGIPPHPPPSRRTFIRKTFFKLITNIVISDFAKSVLAQNPAFDSRLHDPTDGPETYLAAVPLLRRAPYVLSFGVEMGASMGTIHNTIALVCVGLGISSPTLWPDIWGRWRDGYTLRKLWGQTWHQQLRPKFAGLGKLVANKILKFPRGTNRSSYTQLYVAFFLSGLLHFGGDFMIDKRMVYRSFTFFLLQAVAITFEDFVIYLGKRFLRWRGIEFKPGKVGESWAEAGVRVIGYCWVTIWFCLTLPGWIDGLNVAGFGIRDRAPITQFLLETWKQRA